jgi:hypothetical protein
VIRQNRRAAGRRLPASVAAVLFVVSGLSAVATGSVRAPGTAVTLTVAPAAVGYVGPGFVGLSFEKDRLGAGVFDPGNTALVSLFRLLGPSVLRIGGNLVDIVGWTPTGAGGSTHEVGPPDVTRLGGFLRATGWTVLYGINLKTNTEANAANEARFVAHALGRGLLAFEIGNEPDVYRTQRKYEQEFEAYAAAIRAAVPGARFDGPGTLTPDWLQSFATRERNDGLDMLAMHAYVGQGGATIPRLLMSGWSSPRFAAIETALQGARSANGIRSWRMTETNSFLHGGAPGVSDVQAAALWALDLMHGVAMHNGDGVNFHGGTSAQFPLTYTPIAFSGSRPTGVRAVYYAGLLWTLAGTGPLRQASIVGSRLVSAWGIGDSLIVNNKNPWPVDVTAHLTVPAAGAGEYLLTADSLTSRAITLASSPVGADGRFTPTPRRLAATRGTVAFALPGGSAALIVPDRGPA